MLSWLRGPDKRRALANVKAVEPGMLAFKRKKSAGIRVETRVYRLIQQGNTARDRERWADAVAAYRAALALQPALPHIQLQLGHALKEADRIEDADAAYAEAARLAPDDDEPVLHRAHLAKRTDRAAAAAHFATFLLRRGDDGAALRELNDLLEPFLFFDQAVDDDLRIVAECGAGLHSARLAAATGPEKPSRASMGPLLFDLTDLVGHFRHQRLPTGIQRVQIEVLAALLDRRRDGEIAACCFVSGRDGWMEVPLALLRDLTRLSTAGGDETAHEWRAARARLLVHLALADPYILPWRAVLVNLGSSLWVHDYFRFIRNAKAERQISYVPLIHDMIPVRTPDYCVPGIVTDFAVWLAGLFQHADGFLANSQSTKRDLQNVARQLGHQVPDDRIEVLRLDADFGCADTALPATTLDRWNLAGAAFALFVATIEPRKNHGLAFDAWVELLRRHGPDAVPRLVCVGRDGWMNDDVFDRLDTDPVLAAHVTLIPQASDAELALLYRECRFTIFPSLYEGWGLPVTESLCHGRVPVIADNSALPEAGAGFALPFASGSLPDLVRAVELVAFDASWRAAREAEIAAKFTPRSWSEIADQIETAAARLFAAAPAATLPPVAELGLYYPVSLHEQPGLWPGLASGEIFRIGEGWAWPDAGGCRTMSEGGLLRMRVSGRTGRATRLYLRLRGLESAECPVIATVDGFEIGTMSARPRKYGWMACDLPADAGEALDILVRGGVTERIGLSAGGHKKDRDVSISVAGFFLCDRDDEAANAAFVRARRHNLDAISAYRDRTQPAALPDSRIVGRRGID